jgi:DNA-binding Lrp family transcriptional regulator
MMDDTLDFHLLNDFQRDFPLCPAPLPNWPRASVWRKGRPRRLENLRRDGKISRVGAVFAPKRIGAIDPGRHGRAAGKLDAVAAAVNRFPEVNHNYEREHRYNLWFVVTAGSEGRLHDAGGHRTGCRLP